MQSCVSNFKRWKWKFKEVIFPKVIEPGCVKNEETGCFCRNRGGLDGEKFGGSRVSGRSREESNAVRNANVVPN